MSPRGGLGAKPATRRLSRADRRGRDRGRADRHRRLGLGLPFLTSTHGYVTLPGLEPFELASAMGFDLGVFLCVLGAVMLALDSLARLSRAADKGAR